MRLPFILFAGAVIFTAVLVKADVCAQLANHAAGVACPDGQGPILNRGSILIDAAVAGHGVALARTTLAAWDLINGRLVRPIDVSLRLSKTYWIVCPKATSALPKITLFREWLLAEAADDMRLLKALKSG